MPRSAALARALLPALAVLLQLLSASAANGAGRHARRDAAPAPAAAAPEPSCDARIFGHPLVHEQLTQGSLHASGANSSEAGCLAACCDSAACNAWQILVSSSDSKRAERECWLAASTSAKVAAASDTWRGGAMEAGAAIPPLSRWWWYNATAPNTVLRELTSQARTLLRTRTGPPHASNA